MILSGKLDNKKGIRINPDYDVRKKIHKKNPYIQLHLGDDVNSFTYLYFWMSFS